MKACTKCGIVKPLTEFHRNRTSADGHVTRCKSCVLAKQKGWYESNKAQILARAKARYEYTDEDREAGRNRYLFRTYGMTSDDYDSLLASQGGVCARCGTDDPRDKHNRFHVDHDHACCAGEKSCGKCVRGLLCSFCNTQLGAIERYLSDRESWDNYLERYAVPHTTS
jgi:hypothetical protein